MTTPTRLQTAIMAATRQHHARLEPYQRRLAEAFEDAHNKRGRNRRQRRNLQTLAKLGAIDYDEHIALLAPHEARLRALCEQEGITFAAEPTMLAEAT